MKRLRNILSAFLSMILAASVTASAAEYSLSGSKIASVTIPDDFKACTASVCDEDLEKLLKANKFTYEQWQNEVMKPSGYELYAVNIDKGQYIYLSSNESGEPETKTNDDGTVTHKLMKDYKLLTEEEDKKESLSNLKNDLIKQGISADSIETVQWIKIGDDYTFDYIEYLCYSGKEYFHCYEMVYDAAKIELQFTSPIKFSEEEKSEHLEVLKGIKYSKNVDYSEVRDIIHDNLQKKLEEETHSGENTKILRTSISASIVLIIIFAVLLAIRSQKRKRRKYIINNSEHK